jgi:hypothetical protein
MPAPEYSMMLWDIVSAGKMMGIMAGSSDAFLSGGADGFGPFVQAELHPTEWQWQPILWISDGQCIQLRQ